MNISNSTLVIKPTGLPEHIDRPWALVLRTHDLGGTGYRLVAHLTDDMAREVMEAGPISWLYGEPDWDERFRKRQLERARVMREEAEKIEAANSAAAQ